jgi:thiopeptide-type bacteriocin biosynthesis protein
MKALLASEDIFCADSEAVLHIIQSSGGQKAIDSRWKIALIGIDDLLSDLSFDTESRLELLSGLRASFEREFGLSTNGKKALADKFRSVRGELEQIWHRPTGDPIVELARQAFATRSVQLRTPVKLLRECEDSGELLTTYRELAVSYVHMHVNRVVPSAARAHELLLYDFLHQFHRGRVSRDKRRSAMVK